MAQDQNFRIAERLLAGIGQRTDPDEIATLFNADVEFEVAGDDGIFPWVGKNNGHAAVVTFIRGTRELIENISFDIEDIVAGDRRAVILGKLASKVETTGKLIETAFALILTVTDGKISRFQMLEDSFAVSKAVRP